MKLRVATRGSQLARTQTQLILDQLCVLQPELETEIVVISTRGDQVQDRPLASLGGKGLFVAEVQTALLLGEADFAVHSLKDVPGDQPGPEDLVIACTPRRADPCDVLVTRDGTSLALLPTAAKIGTCSLRRMVQLKARRPDLRFLPLRGNVDTRLRRLHEGEFDAIVLAAAGLKRLGLFESVRAESLIRDECLPAVGQGILALEARQDRPEIVKLLAQLGDPITTLEAAAERSLLIQLEGNCHTPIAGNAEVDKERRTISLSAMVSSIDGERVLSAGGDHYFDGELESDAALESAAQLGVEVATALLTQGAHSLIQQSAVSALQDRLTSN